MASKDINELIIDEVLKYDCLYNFQSPLYNNFKYKEDMWEKIGGIVGVPGEDAKKKWRNVRDNYKKYKQKKKIPSGSECKYRKPYKYAESLSFLDDIPDRPADRKFYLI